MTSKTDANEVQLRVAMPLLSVVAEKVDQERTESDASRSRLTRKTAVEQETTDDE